MAMRLSSAGTRRSSRSSSTPLRFVNATKSRHLMEERCVSENSHPSSLQLNIPHTNSTNQKKSMPSFPQKQSHRRRSSSPSTISTTARKMVQTTMQDDEAAMLQYLNRQHHQRKNANSPETWSVKLPAYHSMQQQPTTPTPTKSKLRKSYPPPNSMFRGNASGVSPAVLSSFDAVEDDTDEWLAERREPFATIEESSSEKRTKWKKWFSN
mmetsp:Transcript_8336/g.20067  ORF Transcript_8336/g.20067 Transcript_8336/m.20067 type:complete len:210 (+) Transcript_8336:214-843(+)